MEGGLMNLSVCSASKWTIQICVSFFCLTSLRHPFGRGATLDSSKDKLSASPLLSLFSLASNLLHHLALIKLLELLQLPLC